MDFVGGKTHRTTDMKVTRLKMEPEEKVWIVQEKVLEDGLVSHLN